MNHKEYSRIWAFAIDALVFSLLASIISSLLFAYEEKLPLLGVKINGWLLCYNLCVLLYFFIFDVTRQGVTIGKSILAIKVYHGDGSLPSLKQLLLRSLIKFVSILIAPVSLLVYLFAGKTLHDTACDTKTI